MLGLSLPCMELFFVLLYLMNIFDENDEGVKRVSI